MIEPLYHENVVKKAVDTLAKRDKDSFSYSGIFSEDFNFLNEELQKYAKENLKFVQN